MTFYDGKSGFITVITGPMYAEKTGELINRCMKKEKYAGKKVIAFKPSNDNRFSEGELVSRLGYRMPAVNINKNIDNNLEKEIFELSDKCDIVAFDEVQFFSEEIVDIISEIAFRGKQVIVAGLDLDYRGKTFGSMGHILAIADEVIKKTAYCSRCGRPAQFTQRLVNNEPAEEGPIELIGDSENYEPRCRNCYAPPSRLKKFIMKTFKIS